MNKLIKKQNKKIFILSAFISFFILWVVFAFTFILIGKIVIGLGSQQLFFTHQSYIEKDIGEEYYDDVSNDNMASAYEQHLKSSDFKEFTKESLHLEKLMYGISFLLLIFLFWINGWSNLKLLVKKVKTPLPIIIKKREIEKVFLIKETQFYIGERTFSYGFIRKKIILGVDVLFGADLQKTQFILLHEKFHLMFRDSFIKNFLINLKKFIIPLFVMYSSFAFITIIVFGFSSEHLFSSEMLKNAVLGSLLLYYTFYVSIGILSFSKINRFFSFCKEFLCDKFASLSLNLIPNLTLLNEDDFHPSGTKRKFFLEGKKNIMDISPFLLFMVFYFQTVPFTLIHIILHGTSLFFLFTFLLLDVLYFRFFYFKIKNCIVLILISFLCFFSCYSFAYLSNRGGGAFFFIYNGIEPHYQMFSSTVVCVIILLYWLGKKINTIINDKIISQRL